MARTHFALALGAALLLSGPARAADEISTDITADLSGTVANDEDVVEDTGSGAPAKIDLGSLPAATDVTGYSIAVGGDILLSFETTTSLPGGITAAPNDVVRWNGSTYSTEFRGSDHAIPPGAHIDAIGLVGGDLLLSFDVTVALGGLTVQDEDLVRLESTQPDVWTLFFDGSAHGVPAGADLDGADVIDATGHLALSFDISGTVGAVAFDDEDVLDFDPGADAWSMRYDGSAHHAALVAADVDAVFSPEPSAAGLAAAAVLAVLSRRRSRPGLARAARAEHGGKEVVSKLLVAMSLAVTAFLAAGTARAVDGVIEINQASITSFPFSASSGSYRLTSNITVPDANTTAIALGTGASLDLNGFTISGPNTCTRPSFYNPTTMTCSASGSGSGVSAAGGGLVSNGRITGMGRVGITGGSGSAALRIENVQIDNNAQGGVDLYNGVLRNSAVSNNGGRGIFDCYCGEAGVATLIEGNVITYNKGDGVGVGALITGNRISYNGGAGIKHGNAGGTHSRVNGNYIYRNIGVGIDGYGSYSGNSVYGNASSPTQVIGSMADAGGNSQN